MEVYTAQKGPMQCKSCQCFSHTQRYCSYTPHSVACHETHLSGECSTSQQQLQCCSCGRNHTVNYQGCVKWKETKWRLLGTHLLNASRGRRTWPSCCAEGESSGAICQAGGPRTWFELRRVLRPCWLGLFLQPTTCPETETTTRSEEINTYNKGKAAKSQ